MITVNDKGGLRRMEYIETAQEGSVYRIHFNRERYFNAFNYGMLRELEQITEEIMNSDSVKVVLFTAAGKKAFSSGADLKERLALDENETMRNVRLISSVFDKISRLDPVTICKVDGLAFGGGMELILACDFAIAADTAELGLTEVGWGIIPGGGGTQRLAGLAGVNKAREMILLSEKISAADAEKYGIIYRMVKAGDLDEAVGNLMDILLSQPKVALHAAKRAINDSMEHSVSEGVQIERLHYLKTLRTYDRMEALNSFGEKRKPAFRDE